MKTIIGDVRLVCDKGLHCIFDKLYFNKNSNCYNDFMFSGLRYFFHRLCLRESAARVNAFAISSDEAYFVCKRAKGTALQIYDIAKGFVFVHRETKQHEEAITHFDISKNSEWVVSMSSVQGEPIFLHSLSKMGAKYVDFDRGGSHVVSLQCSPYMADEILVALAYGRVIICNFAHTTNSGVSDVKVVLEATKECAVVDAKYATPALVAVIDGQAKVQIVEVDTLTVRCFWDVGAPCTSLDVNRVSDTNCFIAVGTSDGTLFVFSQSGEIMYTSDRRNKIVSARWVKDYSCAERLPFCRGEITAPSSDVSSEETSLVQSVVDSIRSSLSIKHPPQVRLVYSEILNQFPAPPAEALRTEISLKSSSTSERSRNVWPKLVFPRGSEEPSGHMAMPKDALNDDILKTKPQTSEPRKTTSAISGPTVSKATTQTVEKNSDTFTSLYYPRTRLQEWSHPGSLDFGSKLSTEHNRWLFDSDHDINPNEMPMSSPKQGQGKSRTSSRSEHHRNSVTGSISNNRKTSPQQSQRYDKFYFQPTTRVKKSATTDSRTSDDGLKLKDDLYIASLSLLSCVRKMWKEI